MESSPQPGSATHLLGLLRGLGLPAGDYAVFGSGPLLVRGVIDRAGDLDVVCRGPPGTWCDASARSSRNTGCRW